MYHVLIADDDYLMRNSLFAMPEWGECGFRIAGMVSNGKDALEFISRNQVDVVFSDVCMPVMDGIELAKHIHQNYPDIRVIIMSNYSDFDYVKEAFHANVIDYILKYTIQPDTLKPLLEKVRLSIANKQADAPQDHSFELEQQRRSRMIEAINDKSADGVYRKNAVVLTAKINTKALLTQVYTKYDLDLLLNNIVNTISQIVSDCTGYIAYTDINHNIIIYLPFDEKLSEPAIMRKINDYIIWIAMSCKKFFNLNFSFGISNTSCETRPLHQCLEEAFDMLETTPITGADRKKSIVTFNTLSINIEKNLLAAIEQQDFELADKYLVSAFESADDPNIITSELIAIISKICSEFSIDLTHVDFADVKNASAQYQYQQVKKLFQYIIHSLADKQPSESASSHISAAEKYIREHYESRVTLEDIANYVGLVPSYLSTIFKKKTGQTISGYLTNYRLERAKELLEDKNINIKQIYSKVGFNDYNYFITCFKKNYGCTPNQYKKKVQKTFFGL